MPTPAEFQEAAARALKQGAPLVAFDAAQEGLRLFPADIRLRQLLALALARSGASRHANQLLHALAFEGNIDEETLGMLARTYKDLASAAEGPERRQHLEQAFRCYRISYEQTEGYWSGINAATTAALLDDPAESRRLAESVRDQCLALLGSAPGRPDTYWLLATLGEAALLLRDGPAAAAWYRDAIARGTPGVADRVSTRRNARLILRHAGLDPAPIEACFSIPRVAVFSGHLIDRPDRPRPRFPPERVEAAREALAARLRHHDIGFGYASAGNGGDILFHELLLESGQDAHVVLPYNREQFLEDSVDYGDGEWAGRYRAVLERATEVTTASEQRMLAGAMSYEFGFLLLDGMAAVRAQELETDLVCLALWDGQPGDGPGGTASAVAHWRAMNRQIDIIEVAAPGTEPTSVGVALAQPAPANRERSSTGFDAQIVGILFADAAGFSKLTEDQIPRFVAEFLKRIADTIAASEEAPLLCNTWGDGLYLVFRSIAATGRCALRLNDALRSTDWTAHGLPATLTLRIAVHAGPAYACLDPITGRPNYLGSHIALAARIEPVTPPGEVFGSGTFAALAKTSRVRDFTCEYVGQTPLAKGYGVLPMYVLRPAR